ncbi:hypothetical protein KZP23_00980 [Echinicola marina]|uniref:hypothetical protein n=1 Tax=Echinicola marina TaxID=2859768 RepID=UPI001CF6CB40|nr:hypothetical protein [Echinicola marina]UCS93645.1 hypothetical protein KZP23_00980 [Echinicola marina]
MYPGKSIAILFFLFLLSTEVFCQDIPDDYQLLYEQDFSSNTALNEFETTDASSWRISDQSLEIYKAGNYEPKVRSPFNIAMLKSLKFGDFILEADLQQTGKEYGHRDLCIFFGMKNHSNFYYSHIASKPDPHSHNIFLVNDEPRIAIGKRTNEGINWGNTNEWHKIRIERNIDSGSIKIYFDDIEKPIMETNDLHFDYGHIGFGTFDDTGKFDNIKIWGPDFAPDNDSFFPHPLR